MADKPTDFSLHEMEGLKRRMEELSAASEVSASAPQPVQPQFASQSPPPTYPPQYPPLVPPQAPPEADSLPPQGVFSEHSVDAESLQLRRSFRVIRRHMTLLILIFILLPGTVFLVDKQFRDKVYLAMVGYERLDTGESMVVKLGLREIRQRELDTRNVGNLLSDPAIQRRVHELLVEDYNALQQEGGQAVGEQTAATMAALKTLTASPHATTRQRQRISFGRVSSVAQSESNGLIFVRGQYPELHRLAATRLVEALNEYAVTKRSEAIRKFQQEQEEMRKQKSRALTIIHTELREVNRQIRKINEVFSRYDTGKFAVLQKDQYQLRQEVIEMELMELTLQHERLKEESNWSNLKKRFYIRDERDIRFATVKGNPLRSRWRILSNKRDELTRRYTPEHPAMQEINQQVDAIQRQLKETGGVSSMGAVPALPNLHEEELLGRILTLFRKITHTKDKLEAIRMKISLGGTDKLTPGKEKMDSRQQEELHNKLQDLEQKQEGLKSRQRLQMNNVLTLYNSLDETKLLVNHVGKEKLFRATGAAEVQLESPRILLDVALAAVLGLVIGIAAAFLLESVDNRLHTPFDVYYHLRLNYLGVVPYWSDSDNTLISPDKPDSHIAEIYAHLRTNIRYSRPCSPEKVLMVASATQGEGKSTVSANLAISYALEGHNVVLIDGDLRRPRSHKLVDVYDGERAMQYGLSDYLTGDATFEEALYTTTVPGLSLLPAGSKVRNPAKLVGSPDMRKLIQTAEAQFDIIVLDCPAVLPVVDATTLSGHVRGVLLVIAAEEVEVGAVRMALYRLKHVGSPIVGAVLNKVRERSTSYYYYGYRYRGGYYYGPYRRPYATDDAPDADIDEDTA